MLTAGYSHLFAMGITQVVVNNVLKLIGDTNKFEEGGVSCQLLSR